MAEIQLFKGGWNGDVTDRIVPNQRPADGHQKSSGLEDFCRLNKDSFKCGGACGNWYADLKVGDVIGIHTTLTMSGVHAFGIVVKGAEEGLQFRVVSREGNVDLSLINVRVYQYDDTNETMTVVANTTLDAINDIGENEYYYTGYVENYNGLLVDNADMIGLEVVAVPASGIAGEFDIETRLHNSQPARPPAVLHCC